MSRTDDNFGVRFYKPIIFHSFQSFFFLFNYPFFSRPTVKACEVSQNQYSHYKCDENGDLKCLLGKFFFLITTQLFQNKKSAGWQGDLCDVPLCKRGCDPQQGYCKVKKTRKLLTRQQLGKNFILSQRPNECRCKLGFYGEFCERCIPLPGCQNGGCRQPFECHCSKGWKGIFCQERKNST